jgi:DNA (cytosine-5)-methyltransferase 1
MRDLTFVELFAGVGGLSMGLETAGWRCVGHAEWEAFPRRVLARRWPDVPLWGDVAQLNGRDIVQEVGPFTMLTFGAPCQDFSIAGRRSGMDGERSVLVLDALRIWEESGAPFALYENVVGMLSSNNGADFAAILSVFVGDAVAVPARGWRGGGGVVRGRRGVAAWRVLDAQYFGVPQRRRRVFVLGTRTGGLDPAEVLSLLEGVSGHPAKGRATRQGAAADTGASAVVVLRNREGKPGGGKGPLLSPEKSLTLGTSNDQVLFTHTDELAPTLGARDFKGPGSYRNGALQGSAVVAGIPRRLTPVECERLMGWPDGWTDVPDERGKPAPDTARYKACGNGVASPVAAWIGFRLREALEAGDA